MNKGRGASAFLAVGAMMLVFSQDSVTLLTPEQKAVFDRQ
jgi:hypothetical protein